MNIFSGIFIFAVDNERLREYNYLIMEFYADQCFRHKTKKQKIRMNCGRIEEK